MWHRNVGLWVKGCSSWRKAWLNYSSAGGHGLKQSRWWSNSWINFDRQTKREYDKLVLPMLVRSIAQSNADFELVESRNIARLKSRCDSVWQRLSWPIFLIDWHFRTNSIGRSTQRNGHITHACNDPATGFCSLNFMCANFGVSNKLYLQHLQIYLLRPFAHAFRQYSERNILITCNDSRIR